MYQMGPGMYQQVQQACEVCKGEGETVEESKKCKTCLGKKIIKKQKIIEVPLVQIKAFGRPNLQYIHCKRRSNIRQRKENCPWIGNASL